MKLLSKKEMVLGLPKIDSLNMCEGRIHGKQCKKPFSMGKSKKASSCLELLHVDLCGPMQTKSFDRSRYFLLFTYDYNHMSWVYFLKSKSKTFKTFKKFKAFVKKQNGGNIKARCINKGVEFLSINLINFLKSKDINQCKTA